MRSLSLAGDTYPIETGEGESHLIRPTDGWLDWNPAAARIHGLTRDKPSLEGLSHDDVARRMVEALSGHALYASAPSWDAKWVSVLLRRAGFPRKTQTLRDR